MGGRPKQTLPELSYPEWVKAGMPPLKLSVGQIAKWVVPSLSLQRVNFLINRGDLYRENKFIHTDHPRNREWFATRIDAPEPVRPPGSKGYQTPPPAEQPAAAPHEMWPPPPPKRQYENRESEGLDIEVILEAINAGTLGGLTGADVQKVARLEAALKTRVEREAKRGLLVERKLVQTVFGRLYMVDSNQWRTLGAKLAPDIGGEFGIEDAGALLRVEQKIDAEVTRILSHVKRLLDDFLVNIGAEPV